MRGKVARALREAANYRPHAKREYFTHILKRERVTLKWDTENKKLSYAPQEVDCELIECVSGPYKEYKMMKRLYKNPENHNNKLTALPTKEAVDEFFKGEKDTGNDDMGSNNDNNAIQNS